MLDEEFDGPEICGYNDDNTYVYGRIAKHYVVVGCLPAGRQGTNSAARVARDMVRTFPHVEFELMVGIGGGIPSSRNDIRLGDVVVSQPKDGFGGVIQYDRGKLKDGRFQRTGQLNAPPEKLLGLIPEMRRLYSDKRKPDRLMEHLQLLDDMEDYQKPTIDRLYTSDYPHLGGQNCDACGSHLVTNRPERQNNRALKIHYGTIASGNSVPKDAKVRDAYAGDQELNILCFETEAAGLMNNVPCLVIRGICDYCDFHRNDDWHKYAALAAAAYARELLLVLRPQRLDAMPLWAGRVAQELQQVVTTVESMDEKITWGKLPPVQEAAFDSFATKTKMDVFQALELSFLTKLQNGLCRHTESAYSG
ncbi:WD40 repeat-containing protein [Histoplasma capsulatum var. duboisii H88]|uniref:WD40 repeat-containing protein n=1 Tax=Ajellomyces capsulatus (strain H88) TaxID=544711 RepID=A0A8A1L977_AJEC8|nr:WD40 repeat-containing protein [Histoplasma capsulatum var. duboisii H88]